MTSEMIEKFVKNKGRKGTSVNLHFKDRHTVKGLFIHSGDYEELKSKNLWRIVSSTCRDEWEKTNDVNLTRIFNGVSFTRLSDEES
jgi:hypothetical protein